MPRIWEDAVLENSNGRLRLDPVCGVLSHDRAVLEEYVEHGWPAGLFVDDGRTEVATS
jgi:hypothetical protein